LPQLQLPTGLLSEQVVPVQPGPTKRPAQPTAGCRCSDGPDGSRFAVPGLILAGLLALLGLRRRTGAPKR